MKRKRFKHTAFMICYMFCGWRLINSFNNLIGLGPGTLIYDFISDITSFNGQIIESPSIIVELKTFLSDELNRMKISSKDIVKAIFTAIMDFDMIDSSERVTSGFYMNENGNPIYKGNFTRCTIRTQFRISTDEKEYIGEYNDIEEWPENWPYSKK